jgi:hypothetical protein
LFEVVPVNLLRESEQGMLRIELLVEPGLKEVLLRDLGLLQGFYCFLAILHGVILAEHAVFIGCYTFSRTTTLGSNFDPDVFGWEKDRRSY